MDWADEKAKPLSPIEQRCDLFHCVFPTHCHCIEDIATALRKAKADGLREAADECLRWRDVMKQAQKTGYMESLERKFREMASEIENPTP